MLRAVVESEIPRLLEYLNREPEFNLFIIGDILNHGLSSDVVDMSVLESDDGYAAVLLRYRNSLMSYAHDPSIDLSDVVDAMNARLAGGGTWMVHGKREIVEVLVPRLRRSPAVTHDQFLCVCRQPDAEVPVECMDRVRIASASDAQELAELMDVVFGPQDRSHFAEEIDRGRTVAAVIRDPDSGKMLSSAQYVAETPAAAMIIGVATRVEARNRGYATACVRRLVTDLQNRGKSACLFYHNVDAGRIYERLGFRTIGKWKMLKFER